MERKKIVAVDFDQTLSLGTWPECGPPHHDLIHRIKNDRDKIILTLWTCREGIELEDAVLWCRYQGIEFDYVNENLPSLIKKFGVDCRKIFADMYIDDKGKHPDTFDVFGSPWPGRKHNLEITNSKEKEQTLSSVPHKEDIKRPQIEDWLL